MLDPVHLWQRGGRLSRMKNPAFWGSYTQEFSSLQCRAYAVWVFPAPKAPLIQIIIGVSPSTPPLPAPAESAAFPRQNTSALSYAGRSTSPERPPRRRPAGRRETTSAPGSAGPPPLRPPLVKPHQPKGPQIHRQQISRDQPRRGAGQGKKAVIRGLRQKELLHKSKPSLNAM